MTDNTRERNLEFGLFALAFGLALAIRLLRLGELPLTDDEARWALQVFDLTKGLQPAIGPQPGYVALTGLVFFVMQASNFAARFVPALFGALLTLTPYYFRDRLGGKPALVLAFFLAIDPGFLALSRLAGSPIIAVVAVLFGLGLWRAGNIRAAGIWVGLALLSGPSLWAGLLGLGVAYGLLRGLFVREEQASKISFDRKIILTTAAYAAGTYLLLGSFFLLLPGGLSAGLAAIPAYFGGWIDFSDVPAVRLLIGLGGYEFFAVLLALAALVRGLLKRDELVITLGLWLVATLVLALAYPSRQVADLAWVLIPLWALAALEVSRHLAPIEDGNWETIGMAVFTVAILVFAGINYAAIALTPLDASALQLRWWVLLGSLALLTVSIAMVAFGWSVPTAVQGSLWGALTVLMVYTLAIAVAASGLRTYHTVEMWPSGPEIGQASTLVSQMNDLSRWKAGVNRSMDVTIAGLDSPALRWLLRDWPLTVSDGFTFSGSPAFLVVSDQFPTTNLETSYRGQDLTWRTYPSWEQTPPGDWLRWSLLHEMPSGQENIILWVRGDVFPDSQNNQ